MKLKASDKFSILIAALFLVLLLGYGLGKMVGAQEAKTLADAVTEAVSEAPTASPTASPTATPTPEISGPININTATNAELQTLHGIGEYLAGQIIDYREANGSFTDLADIMQVSGIGKGIFGDIRDNITIG